MQLFTIKWPAYAALVCGFLLLLCGTLFFAVKETQLSVEALQNGRLQASEVHALRAQKVVTPLAFISGGISKTVRAWQAVLRLPTQSQAVLTAVTTLQPGSATETASLLPLRTALSELKETLTTLSDYGQSSKRLQQKYPQELHSISQAAQQATAISQILTTLSSGTQTWIVVLQNSDELRATGGFAGSYAVLSTHDGILEPIVIEDIYDADGQFTGYVTAPAGVREYTSSNNGLRLPDANWYPDFAQSAETMLQFFALGNRHAISGVGAVTVSVISDILRLTGPVYLPDYNTNVSADTLQQVLREERSEFFPGSIQKKHILSLTMALLQEKVRSLSPADKRALAQILLDKITVKDIQLYAVDPSVQTALSEAGVSPTLQPRPSTPQLPESPVLCTEEYCPHHLLALIESNVGINKINPAITRSVHLTLTDPQTLTGTITFHNSALAQDSTLLSKVTALPTGHALTAKNGYANYQRILTHPDIKVSAVQVADKPLSLSEETYSTPSGTAVLSTGFLVTVLPQAETTVHVTLTTRPGTPSFTEQPLFLFKQAGLQPTLYTLQTPTQSQQFTLTSDLLVPLK